MVEVTDEELRALATRIGNVVESVRSELSTLENKLSDVSSAWTGQAATAYQNLREQWNTEANDIFRTLGEIREAVEQTEATYVASDQDQQSSFSRIQSVMRG
ncbi:WXG100 family type VII secretion target [Allostreptomyces psammosilenae]|uniref:ESAT-6-like protein n=1 Tax=Allostreptomyces psammosilenae TaxID=1892865 RepID=A0A853A1Z5_9ACTN|nr:WXG100 family type VII secretion target [Allostreptomyces psammosilenae]NYI08455.1 WXG100 family type VII secretion target [Allostreptomyces psammosilenae]